MVKARERPSSAAVTSPSVPTGAVTVQQGDRTRVFHRHEDKVQLEQDGQEQLAPALVLDLQTLEVK